MNLLRKIGRTVKFLQQTTDNFLGIDFEDRVRWEMERHLSGLPETERHAIEKQFREDGFGLTEEDKYEISVDIGCFSDYMIYLAERQREVDAEGD